MSAGGERRRWWEGRFRAHLVAFQTSLRDGTSSRRSHVVSSVSFPRRSTKHWPTKAVMESGGVQGGHRGLRAGGFSHGNLGHLIPADRQTPPAPYPGQRDGPACHIAQMGHLSIVWTDRWAPPLPLPLDRQRDTPNTSPRQTDTLATHPRQTSHAMAGASACVLSVATARVSWCHGGCGGPARGHPTASLGRGWPAVPGCCAGYPCTCELPLHGEAKGGLALVTGVLLGPLQG